MARALAILPYPGSAALDTGIPGTRSTWGPLGYVQTTRDWNILETSSCRTCVLRERAFDQVVATKKNVTVLHM